MFERLQKKWKVNGGRLLLILLTFAAGGSLTGYVGKKLMNYAGIENTALYIIVYVMLVTIIWPVMVMLVSIPFGQFFFFKNYIARMGNRLFNRKKT